MKIRDYLALTSVIILSSCNGGSNSTPPSNKANNIGAVEIDVSGGRIIQATFLPNPGQNQSKPLVVQYPHGKFYYLNVIQAAKPVEKHSFPTLAAYLAARSQYDKAYAAVVTTKNKANKQANAGLNFEYGYDIGVIPSTSANVIGSGGQQADGTSTCYNYTAQITGGGDGAFYALTTSQFINQASSDASSLGISGNISASDGLYNGKASVSYNSSYQGSQASSTFSFFSYVAGNVLLKTEAISANGIALLQSNPDQFIATCGNSVVTSIPMGFSISTTTTDSSSSESQNSAINASMSASYATLDSFSASVNTATSSSSISDNIAITALPQGDYTFPNGWTETIGGTTYTSNGSLTASDILLDWENSNPNVCTTGTYSPAQCSSYMTNLSTVQSQIVTDVEDALVNYGLPQDLSLLAYYPNGVQVSGSTDPDKMLTANVFTQVPTVEAQLQALAITATGALFESDVWSTYQTQLEAYVQLLYQVNQLYLRANSQYQIVAGTYQGYPSPSGLDYNNQLSTTLSNLALSYQSDIAPLETIVHNCLNESSTCAGMPNLVGSSYSYAFYLNTSLYSQVISYAGQTPNTNFLSDKLNNSVFLQYQGTYTEEATLSNPGNATDTSEADTSYNGNAIPQVNNSVPMSFIYISNQNLPNSSVLPGFIGFALQGVTLNNPYWPYTGNGQSSISNSPFISSQYTQLPAQQFMYNIPFLSDEGASNPYTLQEYFFNIQWYSDNFAYFASICNMPSKFINGNRGNDTPYQNGEWADNYPSGTFIPTNGFEITTADIANDTLPGFGFFETSATYEEYGDTSYPVAGVFGPAATSNGTYVYSRSLNNIVANGSATVNNAAVPTIANNYILTVGTTASASCNMATPNSDCRNGVYPFGDLVAQSGGYSSIQPMLTYVKSSSNTLSLLPIPAFFPTGF